MGYDLAAFAIWNCRGKIITFRKEEHYDSNRNHESCYR